MCDPFDSSRLIRLQCQSLKGIYTCKRKYVLDIIACTYTYNHRLTEDHVGQYCFECFVVQRSKTMDISNLFTLQVMSSFGCFKFSLMLYFITIIRFPRTLPFEAVDSLQLSRVHRFFYQIISKRFSKTSLIKHARLRLCAFFS